MTGAPLVRLGIRVWREQAEVALAALLPLLHAGAEETEPAPGEVEYATYAPRAELPAERDIRALAGDAVLDVTLTDVPGGWETRWHDHLRPVQVGALRVRPPWVEGAADDLVIDPGALFGAGTHPTTQLCLELLLDAEPDGALCDWGAGTGVLAVAAARLGWAPVTAVEVMPDGLEAIRANAAANGVDVKAVWSNLAETPAPWAPTVVANLPLELLLDVPVERPPERLFAAGFLVDRADEVAERFRMPEVERRVLGEWAAVVLERP
ncbi:MAG: 50S ribosomal protein L11 methyltransferase [Solirubrobacteraceae bacterium]